VGVSALPGRALQDFGEPPAPFQLVLGASTSSPRVSRSGQGSPSLEKTGKDRENRTRGQSGLALAIGIERFSKSLSIKQLSIIYGRPTTESTFFHLVPGRLVSMGCMALPLAYAVAAMLLVVDPTTNLLANSQLFKHTTQ